MEAKYYTPEFYEFHEGLEYQDNLFNISTTKTFTYKDVDGWRKNFFIKGIDNNQIKIKCLDREDIESLGWIQEGLDGYFLIEDIVLRLNNDYLLIYDETNQFLFRGRIKNKSELKKIMIQTGIIEK